MFTSASTGSSSLVVSVDQEGCTSDHSDNDKDHEHSNSGSLGSASSIFLVAGISMPSLVADAFVFSRASSFHAGWIADSDILTAVTVISFIASALLLIVAGSAATAERFIAIVADAQIKRSSFSSIDTNKVSSWFDIGEGQSTRGRKVDALSKISVESGDLLIVNEEFRMSSGGGLLKAQDQCVVSLVNIRIKVSPSPLVYSPTDSNSLNQGLSRFTGASSGAVSSRGAETHARFLNAVAIVSAFIGA